MLSEPAVNVSRREKTATLEVEDGEDEEEDVEGAGHLEVVREVEVEERLAKVPVDRPSLGVSRAG